MNIMLMTVKKKSKSVFRLLLQIFIFQGISISFFLAGGCRPPVAPKDGSTLKKEAMADTLSFLKVIDSVSTRLQTGDLVFRLGNDFASQTFANMNRTDKRFSHVGIISLEDSVPLVYHCLGGSFNPDQKMLREKMNVFLAPVATKAFGIFRIQAQPHSMAFQQILHSLYSSGVPFDIQFDLTTNDRLYCSEMVYKVLRKIYPNIDLKIEEAGSIKYVSTETFTRSPEITQLLYRELK